MKKTEFHILSDIPESNTIYIEDYIPSTYSEQILLISGYDIERNDFNLYYIRTKDQFYLDYGKKSGYYNYLEPKDCVPNKRVYPEKSDFEFCTLLKKKGVHIPFTQFNDINYGG